MTHTARLEQHRSTTGQDLHDRRGYFLVSPQPRWRISHELRERLRDFALLNGGAAVSFANNGEACVMRVTDRRLRSYEVEICGAEYLWHAALDEFDRTFSEAPAAGLSRFLASCAAGGRR